MSGLSVMVVAQALGGIGVFLLGMLVMTEGLKALAGARVSHWLVHSTRSPWSGALTGALGTALLQSSSATTVAAVGFVGAGLLDFSQALGIIFGANLGTTITGWMVALFGFKLQLGLLAMPLVFIGVMLRLFAPGRGARIGHALAGFALIFIGIDLLQQAMAGYGPLFDPQDFPPDSLWTRLRLVGIGILVTLVTQSSSAGVAATLAALHAGSIEFGQAAALVIGMDVGTTATAALATIGGSIGARRTGLSHVIYNLMTAVGALLWIDAYSYWLGEAFPQAIRRDPEIALVGFHSSFNALGVLLVLPFAHRFARWIERLIPESPSRVERELDAALLSEPQAALEAADQVLRRLFAELLECVDDLLERGQKPDAVQTRRWQQDLRHLQVFLDEIHIPDPRQPGQRRLTALLHAADHLQRLYDRCAEDAERAEAARDSAILIELERALDDAIESLLMCLESGDSARLEALARALSEDMDNASDALRDALYLEVAEGDLTVGEAQRQAEALRWLQRVSRHLYRIAHYLARSA